MTYIGLLSGFLQNSTVKDITGSDINLYLMLLAEGGTAGDLHKASEFFIYRYSKVYLVLDLNINILLIWQSQYTSVISYLLH